MAKARLASTLGELQGKPPTLVILVWSRKENALVFMWRW